MREYVDLRPSGEIELRTQPNQGIRRSARNGLSSGLSGGNRYRNKRRRGSEVDSEA